MNCEECTYEKKTDEPLYKPQIYTLEYCPLHIWNDLNYYQVIQWSRFCFCFPLIGFLNTYKNNYLKWLSLNFYLFKVTSKAKAYMESSSLRLWEIYMYKYMYMYKSDMSNLSAAKLCHTPLHILQNITLHGHQTKTKALICRKL